MACPSHGQAETAGERGRRVELADIVREHGAELERRHALTTVQRRAMRAIEQCRTAALGGHLETCPHCSHSRAVYHSCDNRHCPKCQVLAKERWVERRCASLLPVRYFHVVFTLPHELNALALRRPRLVFDALFRCSWQSLDELACDPMHLGAKLGVTAVLHTWTQTLAQHVHLHCLVTSGGLAPSGDRWVSPRRGFLLPVRALSRLFRGKMLAALWAAREAGELEAKELPHRLRRKLTRHDWVVYSKPPFAGPEHLVGYLGRYTHRIAISNDRILDFRDGKVSFTWRDRSQGDRQRVMTMPAVEFLQRFLLHVLPDGFQRIRHYGLHANRVAQASASLCRELLRASAPAPPPEAESVEHAVLRLTGIDITKCPACGRQGLVRTLLPPCPVRGPPTPRTSDQS